MTWIQAFVSISNQYIVWSKPFETVYLSLQERGGDDVVDLPHQPGGGAVLRAGLPRRHRLHEEVLPAAAALIRHQAQAGTRRMHRPEQQYTDHQHTTLTLIHYLHPETIHHLHPDTIHHLHTNSPLPPPPPSSTTSTLINHLHSNTPPLPPC